jgi:hypothetical protein
MRFKMNTLYIVHRHIYINTYSFLYIISALGLRVLSSSHSRMEHRAHIRGCGHPTLQTTELDTGICRIMRQQVWRVAVRNVGTKELPFIKFGLKLLFVYSRHCFYYINYTASNLRSRYEFGRWKPLNRDAI